MRKIYVLGIALCATTFSFAQEKQAGQMEKSWERMELSGDRSEDTLSPPSFSDACINNGFGLYSSTNGGYVNGTNGYGDIGAGQMFPLDGQATVEGYMAWYGAIENNGGATQILGSIMDKNGNVLGGTLAAHTVASVDTTAAGAAGWYTYTFSSAVAVTDTFICMTAWSAGADTLGFVSTVTPCGGFAYETWSDGTVADVASSWGITVDLGFLALVNNLEYTGIFDTEAADFGVYQNGTNLHVNGINIDAFIQEVMIVDMAGRTIKTWPIADQWDNYTFDISNVPAGNYVIALKSNKGHYAQKFNLK
ncbi:T9SS type A sorting domain-containing protein [Paracrocinitomix mangrovi]|uniref:T9SS type A sorting domain-containing protein n=1 Tax=Paracrocinitomix mangrovi TaxID=2862509 RepID=UPI001C8D660E|nr:T9SS type A sorting domain-containing protein [Paracrocinitomix mangrovi]UKN02661.1 T9SS type A sorting domain-containing protein [Paracrocinitomix mangrovi]